MLRVLGQTALHNPNERSGRLKHSGNNALGLVAKDGGGGFRRGLLLKRRNSRDHFVEHRPEGKLVGTKIEFGAVRLLR